MEAGLGITTVEAEVRQAAPPAMMQVLLRRGELNPRHPMVTVMMGVLGLYSLTMVLAEEVEQETERQGEMVTVPTKELRQWGLAVTAAKAGHIPLVVLRKFTGQAAAGRITTQEVADQGEPMQEMPCSIKVVKMLQITMVAVEVGLAVALAVLPHMQAEQAAAA